MKYWRPLALAALVTGAAGFVATREIMCQKALHQTQNQYLKEIFDTKYQFTGIAVSHEGRMFVNFPLWFKPYKYAIAEIKDGKMVPFPDKEWTKWKPGKDPSKHFVCPQALWIDKNNYLWVVDPAAPGMQMAIRNGPKLVKIDLKTNQVVQVIQFDEWVAPENSYINDVRIDNWNNFAYLTDSNLGAIIVVNLINGQARRVLANHPSTRAEQCFVLMAEGRELKDKQGFTPKIHSDGIALDANNQYLYYHPLTGNNLYRIDTRYLKDFHLSNEDIEKHVELVASTGPTDGMIIDKNNNIYLTSFPDNSIKRYNIDTRSLETIVQDPRLVWPDSFAWSPDGSLYVTTSQVNRMPFYNESTNKPKMPYRIFKINLENIPTTR